jgi:hypothetical protein
VVKGKILFTFAVGKLNKIYKYNIRMKKILIAFALLSAVTLAEAQMTFRYGIKGGLNLATYDSDADDAQCRLGQWGVLCRFEFGSFAVQPELFYARQGVRSLERNVIPELEDSWITESDYKLMLLSDNVQLPIMVKYYLPIEKIKGFNIQAGPQFSQRFDYKISSPSEKGYLGGSVLGGVMSKRAFAQDMNQFTVMANMGIGFDSESGIGVDVRCSMGITPVFKGDITNPHTGEKFAYNSNSHDRVWSISFTYLF